MRTQNINQNNFSGKTGKLGSRGSSEGKEREIEREREDCDADSIWMIRGGEF